MFSWLARHLRKSAAPRSRFVRPGLEGLESRDCPSVLTLSVAYGTQNNITLSGHISATATPAGQTILLGGKVSGMTATDANGNYAITLPASGPGQVQANAADGQSNTATAIVYDMVPQINNFVGVESLGDIWTFSGDVNYRSPEGLTINFDGIASLQHQTAEVDANGHFSLTLRLNGTSTDNGIAYVSTTDWYGYLSNTAQALVSQT